MRIKSFVFSKCKYDLLFVSIGLLSSIFIAMSSSSFAIKLRMLLPNNGKILTFSLPFLASILPIIVAVTILIYQLYFNRYIIKELKKSINIDLIILFSLLSISICCTFLFWILGENSFLLSYLNLFCLFYLLIRLFIFIYYYNNISIKQYIDKISQEIIDDTKHINLKEEIIIQAIRELDEYFIESIEKNENVYIQSVINNKEKIFLNYIENKDKLHLKEDLNKNEIDKIDEKFNKSVVRDCINIANATLNKIEINHFYKYIYGVLVTCIKCEKEKLFINITNDLWNLALKEKNSNNQIFYELNYTFRDIYKYLIELDFDLKYEEQIEDLFSKSIIICELFIDDNVKLKEILVSNFEMLSLKLVNRDFDKYSKLYKEVLNNLEQIINNFNKTESEYLVFCLNLHLSKIEDKGNQKTYNLFIFKLVDLIKYSIKAKNDNLILKLGYLLSEGLSEDTNFEVTTEIQEKRNNCLLDCINIYPEAAIVYFPKYEVDVEKNKSNFDYIENISKNYIDILYRAIRIENYKPLYFAIKTLDKCVYVFEQKDREQQELMLNVYKEILISCISLREYKSFDFVIYKFYDTLKKLNDANKISKKLLFFILNIFDSVGRCIVDDKESEIFNTFLHNFSNLSKEISMIETDKEYKKRIIDIIFNYGIDSIENKNIKNLKICSNHLGWYAKSLYDSGDDANYKEIIDLAIQLYNLADIENFDKSVKSFLGTLFIILGSYTNKEPFNLTNTYIVKNIHKLNDTEPLKISKILREYRHTYWDDIFDGKAKQEINDFYIKLKL